MAARVTKSKTNVDPNQESLVTAEGRIFDTSVPRPIAEKTLEVVDFRDQAILYREKAKAAKEELEAIIEEFGENNTLYFVQRPGTDETFKAGNFPCMKTSVRKATAKDMM
jgi:hypothetical protein